MPMLSRNLKVREETFFVTVPSVTKTDSSAARCGGGRALDELAP